MIEGPLGSGRTTACARAAERDLLLLDLKHIGNHQLSEALNALRREMLLSASIAVLANVDHLLGDEQREQRKMVGEFINHADGPLVVTVTVAGTDLGTERPVMRIAWDVPESGVRAQLWREATRSLDAPLAGDLSTLACRYRVGPAAIGLGGLRVRRVRRRRVLAAHRRLARLELAAQ